MLAMGQRFRYRDRRCELVDVVGRHQDRTSHRHPRGRRRWHVAERGIVLGEYRRLDGAQLGPGVDAQVVDELAPTFTPDLQGVGLPPGDVERRHQQCQRVLAVGMLGDEQGERRDSLVGPPRRHEGLGPALGCVGPHLVEPRRLATQCRPVRHVCQR